MGTASVMRGLRRRPALAAALAAACCALALALAWLLPQAALATDGSTATVGEGQRVSEGSLVDDGHGMGVNGFKRLNKGTSRKFDGVSWGYRFPVNDPDAFIVLAMDGTTVVFVPQVAAEAVGLDADDQEMADAFLEMVYELDELASDGGALVRDLGNEVVWAVGASEAETPGALVKRDVAIGDGHTYLTVQRTDGAKDSEGIVCCDYGLLVPTSAVSVEAVPTWWQSLASFLSTIDYRPLWVSLKTSFTALAVVFVLGLLAAWRSMGVKSRWKGLVDTLFTIPMVLPPTVCGFLLLLLFGNATPFGRWLLEHGVKLVFSWPATVIAATVVAFPLMYRTARGAFEALDSNMLDAARTLGWSERHIFYRLMIPLAWPSIAAGTVLAFARAMGEFGATLFCAGNYAGITQTMPIAIYFQWMGGNTDVAIFWVVVVILISFLVILVINLYSARSQRYRRGGLVRRERKSVRGSQPGQPAETDGVGDSAFDGIRAGEAKALLGERGAGL